MVAAWVRIDSSSRYEIPMAEVGADVGVVEAVAVVEARTEVERVPLEWHG